MRSGSAVAARAFADAKIRTGAFGLVFALMAFANAVGYRHSFPTAKDRLELLRTFGANRAVELFYGAPRDLLTVGGYTAWRLAGFGSLLAGVWAVFAAVRALRADEETGRQELVLAGSISRAGAFCAAVAAIGAGGAALGAVTLLGLVAAGLPLGGSAYLALATISPVPVFAGVGALASQLTASRRLALELGTAVFGAAFVLRVVADTVGGAGWARWATPLGWTEELRPFAGASPWPLFMLFGVGAILLAASGAIAARRDSGVGLIASNDEAPPSTRLLSSPTALALRSEIGTLAGWLAGVGAFAVIVGVLSTAFTAQSISVSLRQELGKIGGTSLATPTGALGLYFVFFVLVISLFTCAQVAAMHREEEDERLETLFVLPVGRVSWLAGRLALAALAATGLALAAGAFAWAGSAAVHAHVSLARMLEAGANCLPAAALFLGIGVLSFGVAPRASAGIAYGVVVGAFLWQLIGSLVGAPHWLLESTPFAHVAAVPSQPFRALAAVALLAIGAAAALGAFATFRIRDLRGR